MKPLVSRLIGDSAQVFQLFFPKLAQNAELINNRITTFPKCKTLIQFLSHLYARKYV